MRKTISGSGRGAYNSTLAAAARAMRKTSSSSSSSQGDTFMMDRTNSSSSTGPVMDRSNSNSGVKPVMARSASGSADESDSSPVALQRDTSLQQSNKGNTGYGVTMSSSAAAEHGSDASKPVVVLTKQLLKTASANATASVYGQNLVTRTMRSTNSGHLGVPRAAFRV